MQSFFPEDRGLRILLGVCLALCLSYLACYHFETDLTIDWSVLSTAKTVNQPVLEVQKGPFQVDVLADWYVINERFVGGDIQHTDQLSVLYMFAFWAAVCLVLASATFLKRFYFLTIGALSILMINYLDLDSLGVFGSRPGQKWLTGMFMILTLGPAYYFHAFKPTLSVLVKTVGILIPSSLMLIAVIMVNGVDAVHYFNANTLIAGGILTTLFVFVIAEEIIFLILYIITQSRGGTNNEKHFLIFGLVYLGLIGAYYAKQAGLISADLQFVNLYYLLIISFVIAVWGFQHKQILFEGICDYQLDVRWVLVGFGSAGLVFMSYWFVRGNDPATEAVSYMIIYAHVAFGAIFFIYIIANFIEPLMQGMQVYKVAYKEYNFPYSTARLAGFVGVIAFYFLSEQQPYLKITAGYYNALGDYHDGIGESGLGEEYYRQGSVYGWDNHYSNYQLGQRALLKNDHDEAAYRFTRATKRNPSPYAYVNLGNVSELAGKSSLRLLNEGLADFPGNAEISNNLALHLGARGSINEAMSKLENGSSTEDWNKANLVNKWSFVGDQTQLTDFNEPSLALKTNVYSKVGAHPDLKLDTSVFQTPNVLTSTLLVNANYAARNGDLQSVNARFQKVPNQYPLNFNLDFSEAMYFYRTGKVNKSFDLLENIAIDANPLDKGKVYQTLGKLALDQDAPRLALDYFERAVPFDTVGSEYLMAIAFLEARMWDQALGAWMMSVGRDSTLAPMLDGMFSIIQNTDDESFAYLYYRHGDLNPEEIDGRLNNLPVAQKGMLIEKIYGDNSKYFGLDQFEDLQIKTNNYRTDAKANAFNEYAILKFAADDSVDLGERYNTLVEAVELNKYAPNIIKQYCLTAVEMGLTEYGDQILYRLHGLISTEEFNSFELQYYEAEQKRKELNNSWNL
ncbi:MAG: hypothetical protein JXQ90_20835 [Cyclobacteriaceae bacterium]